MFGVQPSMGEIWVARGKRRRSAAPGRKWKRQTVRAEVFFKVETFFRTELYQPL
jgi:hypothetical protein